jgi:hypothetical protein
VEQFSGSSDSGGVGALPVVEFTRRLGAERVRVVAEPVGYTIWLECD